MLDGKTAPGAGDDLTYGMQKLAARLREMGHRANTLDMDPGPFDAAIFMDHPTLANPYFRKLRKTQTKLYLFLLENAINRPDNYWKWLHRDFEKVFVWNPKLVDHKKYIQFYHSFKIPSTLKINPEEKTKFCLTISSQKYSSNTLALYKERTAVVRWFEREHPDQFDLYGQRWDRRYFSGRLWRLNIFLARLYQKYPNHFKANIFPSFRGPVARKLDTMRAYKFAIVYENAVVPGYLTEKIFDAFFAGCLPIYRGAPDVLDYLPPEIFIDDRNFSSYEEMYRFINGMSQSEYLDRISAIEEFVNGPKIRPFSAENFIEIFTKHIVTG
jgi:hypothetical protein